MMFRQFLPGFLLVLLLALAACTPQRKLIYFQGTIPTLAESEKFRLRLYPGDIISVSVFTTNTEAYPFLSMSTERPVSDTRSGYEKGIVVSEAGTIKMPLIGTVNLNGLCISDATDTLEKRYEAFMLDPIVTLRKLNFKVTVLGEVNKPGTFSILNEKATLPEVLGLAGDLSQFADHEKIRIIREENNQTRDFFVDITSAQALAADHYFLHPDDIVYVPPVKRRAIQNISPSVTLFTSIITTAIVAFTLIVTNSR